MRIVARMPASAGPRTFAAQGLTEESASMIFELIVREGGAAVIGRDGPRVDMERHLTQAVKRRAAAAKAASPVPLLALASAR